MKPWRRRSGGAAAGMSADPAALRFWLLWTALLLVKFALAAVLPLFGDEAFYWWESRHPAWAYSDLPGLTAWLVGAGAAIGGDSALGVRWPFLLLAAAGPLLVADMARRIGGAAAGWRAGTWSLLLPLFATLGVLALPDVPMTLAGLVCIDALVALRRRVTAGAMLALALGLVVGALAHYRFALLIGAGAVGLLLDPRGRALLRRPALWAALLAGALAWLPLIAFNLAHGGAGVRFQLLERHPWAFQPEGLAQPLVQAGVVTPLLYVLLLGVLWQAWRRRGDADGPWRLLLGSSGALLLGLWLAALFADTERVSFHWPLPAYLPLLALLPVVQEAFPRWLRTGAAALAALGTVALLAVLALASDSAGRAWLAERGLYPDNFGGWEQAASQVRDRLVDAPPGTVVVADNFMLAAQLAFAFAGEEGGGARRVYVLDHPLNRKHGRALQLQLWQRDVAALAGEGGTSVLLVIEDGALRPRERLAWYHTLCDQLGRVGPYATAYADGHAKRFLFAAAHTGFDGACALPALAWVDRPAPAAELTGETVVNGWAFKDGAGIDGVWVTLDGVARVRARYGVDAPHVSAYWVISADPAHPRVGFRATLPLEGVAPGVHTLGLLVVGADGSREEIAARRVQVKR